MFMAIEKYGFKTHCCIFRFGPFLAPRNDLKKEQFSLQNFGLSAAQKEPYAIIKLLETYTKLDPYSKGCDYLYIGDAVQK